MCCIAFLHPPWTNCLGSSFPSEGAHASSNTRCCSLPLPSPLPGRTATASPAGPASSEMTQWSPAARSRRSWRPWRQKWRRWLTPGWAGCGRWHRCVGSRGAAARACGWAGGRAGLGWAAGGRALPSLAFLPSSAHALVELVRAMCVKLEEERGVGAGAWPERSAARLQCRCRGLLLSSSIGRRAYPAWASIVLTQATDLPTAASRTEPAEPPLQARRGVAELLHRVGDKPASTDYEALSFWAVSGELYCVLRLCSVGTH